MAAVTTITTTGDNDPPIFPERYERHYMYCDLCGSFELGIWSEPEDPLPRHRLEERLSTFALVAGVAALGLLVLALLGTSFLPFLVALASAVLAYAVADRIASSIDYRGVRCQACGATYAHGDPFFIQLGHNPHRYTIDDIPKPLNRNYSIEGKYLGPVEG